MDEPILILGCNLCKFFISQGIEPFELIWPEKITTQYKFIIVRNKKSNRHYVIFRDHLKEITNEDWKSMIYRCKKILSNDVKLKNIMRKCDEHFYCEVEL